MTAADFIAAVCAAPDADTPRLAFADWLEEQGEADRAEFIRCQLWIAEIDRDLESDEDCDQPSCMGCRERNALRRRERELQHHAERPWQDVVASLFGVWVPAKLFDWEFRRGFVHAITCTAADFLEHADSLCWSPRQTEEVFERGRGCKLCRGRGLMLLPEMALINLPWMELEFMPTEATYSIVEKPCQQCRIIRRQPRPCPDTAQPIREVTLTTWPETEAVRVESPDAFERYGVRLFGRSKVFQTYGALGIIDHQDMLEAEWEGITFRLPGQP
jgi:uncharacterized protein (TIGR02996 family)